jgi:hypothetical protein
MVFLTFLGAVLELTLTDGALKEGALKAFARDPELFWAGAIYGVDLTLGIEILPPNIDPTATSGRPNNARGAPRRGTLLTIS